jgi:hypothetical protein
MSTNNSKEEERVAFRLFFALEIRVPSNTHPTLPLFQALHLISGPSLGV